jgi:Histidine kinase-, DNA gyrase B-, and HSP90-like ATPase
MKPGKATCRSNVGAGATALLALFTIGYLPATVRSDEPPAPKRVLVLYWYGKDTPINVRLDKSIQEVLLTELGGNVEYYPEYLESIFSRLHHDEQYAGTGVGLAIVRKAIERMGGRAWAESKPGRGATFFLEVRSSTDSAVGRRE